MDSERIKGAAQKLKGAIELAAGRAVGNPGLEGRGIADKAEGHIRDAVGKAKDAVREAVREADKPI